MSDKIKLVQLLCNQEFYKNNKHKLIRSMFPDILEYFYDALVYGHERYDRDLTLNELRTIIFNNNPTLTRTKRHEIYAVTDQLDEELSSDIGEDLLSAAYREEFGRRIADLGCRFAEGEEQAFSDIRNLVDQSTDSLAGNQFVEPVTSDIDELIDTIDNRRATWQFNIEALHEKVEGLSGGEFAWILARPELGKSLSWIHMVAGPDGFCDQGANVMVIANEEPAVRHMMRAICSYTGMTAAEVRQHTTRAKDMFNTIRDRIGIYDDADLSIERLAAMVEHKQPDLLVIDQLDKLVIEGQYAREDSMLKALYIEVRRLAKRNNIPVLGLTQASYEAEGKRRVTYSMAAGSRTDKAAEADIVIGIGKPMVPEGAEENLERILTLSKNKITGWKGEITTTIDPYISRFYSH